MRAAVKTLLQLPRVQPGRGSTRGTACLLFLPSGRQMGAFTGITGAGLLAHSFSATTGKPVITEEKDKADQAMVYRMLGNTGLQVSVLSYGFWATYGSKDDLSGRNFCWGTLKFAQNALLLITH